MHLLLNLSTPLVWKLDSETTEGLSKILNGYSWYWVSLGFWLDVIYISGRNAAYQRNNYCRKVKARITLRWAAYFKKTILVGLFTYVTGFQSYICLLKVRVNNKSMDMFNILLLYVIIFKLKSQSLGETILNIN